MPVDLYSKSQTIYERHSPADQRGLYDAIKREYLTLEPTDNPAKIGIPLTYDATGKSMTSFVNVMASRISTGHYGTKTIMCDMTTGKTVSLTMIFDIHNHLVAVLDSAELTAIRCAHMAVLAADLFTMGRYPLQSFRFGFIGAGQINQKTAWLLHDVFGISDFIVRGHPQTGPASCISTPNRSSGNKLGRGGWPELRAAVAPWRNRDEDATFTSRAQPSPDDPCRPHACACRRPSARKLATVGSCITARQGYARQVPAGPAGSRSVLVVALLIATLSRRSADSAEHWGTLA